MKGLPRWHSGKESACNAGDQVWSLSQEGPLEDGMATHSSTLAWRIPQTEEPGGLVHGVTESETQPSGCTPLALRTYYPASVLCVPSVISAKSTSNSWTLLRSVFGGCTQTLGRGWISAWFPVSWLSCGWCFPEWCDIPFATFWFFPGSQVSSPSPWWSAAPATCCSMFARASVPVRAGCAS